MDEVLKMYINGEWQLSQSKNTRKILNPANGKILATVTDGTRDDAIHAIASAKRAFYEDNWMDVTATERATFLFKLADILEKRSEEFYELETLNNGKTLRESMADVSDSVACLRYYAGLPSKPHGITYDVPDNMQSMVVREAIGVCGMIIPWNYPLLMAIWKIAPAISAGNTVVFKPSEITPLTAIKLFEIIDEIGFPKGVINLVLGDGPSVGDELAINKDVDKIAFTGGTSTGRSIMKSAASNIKKISLELGGKSPNIVFEDADFNTAVDYALFGIFCNQGQVCSAGSRLLLQESIYDKFIEVLVEKANKIRIGNGMDAQTEMGPLISENHMNKVLKYIEIGINEGAKIVCGGHRITTESLKNGYFVEPTIFVNTDPSMRIVQEEIFGPVLVVQKFKNEKEAVDLANSTCYGLAGGVFTNDISKAHRVIRKLRAGITWINTYHPTYNEAPWGGYKQSGIGRELGTFGYEEYTEIKQININLDIKPTGWFG